MYKTIKPNKILSFLSILIISLSFNIPTFAQSNSADLRPAADTIQIVAAADSLNAYPDGKLVGSLPAGDRVSIIVRLADAPLASYMGGVTGLVPTSPQATGASRLDVNSTSSQAYLAYLTDQHNAFTAAALSAVPSAQVTYDYKVVIGGVALVVPRDQVRAISQLPGVVAIYPDQVNSIDTDNSPRFIGAPAIWNQLGGVENAGEGVIVGVLDTGIWPEHPSFSDPDPAGNPYDPPPGGPFGCNFGNTAWNPNDVPFTCNNKLVGAYQFMVTYKSINGLSSAEFDSARDSNGHGTHTSSTAAGNNHIDANLLGVDRGLISGIAPRAHVIMYRVCGILGCYTTDSAAAAEQAIVDGADVLNFSISGGTNPYTDIVSLAFLDAYNAGLFVAASAGNSGPGPNTVNHREPWTTTVAASTQNRAFVSTATITAANGDSLQIQGVSVTAGISTSTPIVVAANFGDELCLNPFAAGTFSGQIVICKRGTNARVDKGYNVLQGGAGGMILYNQSTSVTDVETDNHWLPTIHIQFNDGTALLNFLSTHTGVLVTTTEGVKTGSQGDVMASFSSRGGTGQVLGISKPDVTAPGVQILAGMSPIPESITNGPPGQLFQAIAGTSMSSPHVAGSAALLFALHPDWTPGQVKSALMMTARTQVTKEDGITPANAFDHGSGRINLRQAGDPGLTINTSGADFLALQNELWNANYPSVYIPVMPGLITVQRTVHNVTSSDATWQLKASKPANVKIIVPPSIFVPAGGDTTFDITIDARNLPIGDSSFGTISLQSGNRQLHIPVTIVRGQPAVTLNKNCDPATLPVGGTTSCTITIENTATVSTTVNLTDRLPSRLRLDAASLVGAAQVGNGLAFNGSLAGAGAPTVTISEDPFVVGFGYIPLAIFGVAPFPLPSNADDGGWILSGVNINYLGVNYTRVIWSVNGTLQIGDAGSLAASANNVLLPSTAVPNNLLAAWWTDLDLSTGAGKWYVANLTDGVNTWTVFEWANIPRFGDPTSTASFQIWLQSGTDIMWFAYGGFTGSTSDATVGAEDSTGTIGDTYYYGEGGIGSVPDGSLFNLLVSSVPGSAGETHLVTFDATGRSAGAWQNCAELTGDIFQGTNIACTSGEVTP